MAFGSSTAGETLDLTEDALKAECVFLPETVFMLGCGMEHLSEAVRESNERMQLSIGNILDATPPRFVHIGDLYCSRRMVTHAQYKQFLDAPDPDGGPVPVYEQPNLWQFLWQGCNFRIELAKMPFERREGEVLLREEVYEGCNSLVEAYLRSLRFEADRCYEALSLQTEATLKDYQERTERLFAFFRFKLGKVIVDEFNSALDVLEPHEAESIREYGDIQAVVRDIDQVIADCRIIYERNVDPEIKAAFSKNAHQLEVFTFLNRFKTQLNSPGHTLQETIPLRKVLYPRGWRTPEGVEQGGWGKPWPPGDRPVTGLTLYEALAYCLYIGKVSGLSEIRLPSEAEFERISSWPAGEGIPGEELVVDPGCKAIYPWQENNGREFHFHFGQEGRSLGAKAKDRDVYLKQLEATARVVTTPDGKKGYLYELEGYGWHWTFDQYSENVHRYNHFDSHVHPHYEKVRCVDPSGQALTVYEWEAKYDRNAPYVVLKGSPEVIGGPGMTTRRYAAYPLRGYENVGFRWIIP